uniref:F-box associated domain-containing protein n=2 Tax=Aegilops tauschii TaxID=37682 RepID=A0A453LCX8_AEGTS
DTVILRVVSFDLDNEQVAASTFPSKSGRPDDYNLAEVHGRLGLVIRNPSGMREAWVREEERWTRRYILTCSWHDIPRPYGEYYLKTEGQLLYRYPRKGTLSSFGWRLPYDVLKVSDKDKRMLVAKMNGEGREFNYRTFAYVKTSEPLVVYYTGE